MLLPCSNTRDESIKKLLAWYITLFSLAYVFVWVRPEPLAQVANHNGFNLWRFVPLFILGILVVSFYLPKIKIWGKNPPKLKPFIIFGIVITPLLVVLDFINARHVLIGGTFMSLGLMYAMGILAAYKYGGRIVQSLLLGILWAFCFMYSWETMYQIVIYYKSNYPSSTLVDALIPSVYMAVMFLPLLVRYKAKPNKRMTIIAICFVVVITAWILSGANTLIYYRDGWVAESLDKLGYSLTRLSKAIAGLFILGIDFRRI